MAWELPELEHPLSAAGDLVPGPARRRVRQGVQERGAHLPPARGPALSGREDRLATDWKLLLDGGKGVVAVERL